MSDTRFTLLGISLIFAGFITLGIYGSEYFDATIESMEFGDCYEYFDDRPPQPIECDLKLKDKIIFSGLVIGLIAAGVVALVKGVKGRWDQDVKPEDMVGPGGPDSSGKDNSEKHGK
jgi:hypothetical protein